MTNETLQGLVRLTKMPDEDGPGDRIAGQYSYDVEFTGGAISNVTLTDVTINGTATARTETIVTDPGDYTVQPDDYVITVNKTVPEITTITLPASPTESRSIIVKDGQGEATDFPITIDGNGATIDGAPTLILDVNWESVEIIYNGTEWNPIGAYKSPADGDVVGPASSTDNAIARFDGTTGKIIENTGVTITGGDVIVSPVTTGTAPLTIASTTRVSNLNVARAGLADTITIVDSGADTTTFPMLAPSVTGNLAPVTDPQLTYNASTNNLATTTFTGALVGNADTATLAATATLATTVTVADTTDTTCNVALFEDATGSLGAKTDAGLTYNASTGILTATGFSGPITGTASAVNVVDAAGDTTTWPLLATNQTGGQTPATDAGLTFNATTNALTATTFIGALTGNADTATTATNIATATEAADTSCFPVFVTASGTQTLPGKTNTTLTYNASTSSLGATTLSATNLVLTGQSPTYTLGKMVYDTDNECLTFYNNDSNVSLQIGQENWYRVNNNSGSSIANGAAVKITGATAGLPTIALIQSNVADVCAGLATETIANGAIGYVTSGGLVRGIDTSAFSAGVTLYVSSATPGALTATAPAAPNYRIRIGTVGVSNASTGTILVNGLTTGLGLGAGNQVLGVNSGATGQEYKTVAGTANEITVTHGANSITTSIPAAVTFTGKTITGGTYSGPTLSGTVAGTPTYSGAAFYTAGNNYNNSVQNFRTYSNDATFFGISFSKSRDATPPNNTIVQSGDIVGYINFTGANGTTYDSAAYIQANIDGTPGASADMPGRLGFFTALNGTATPAESLRINNAGAVFMPRIGTSASAVNCRIDTASSPLNSFLIFSSSARYKKDIEPLWESEARSLLNLEPVWFRSRSKSDPENYGYWGFLAEDVAEINPRLVDWIDEPVWATDENGEVITDDRGVAQRISDGDGSYLKTHNKIPDGVNYLIMVVGLLHLVKDHETRIEELENKVNSLMEKN